MADLPALADLANRLCSVRGVVGVTLGGSRARGEQSPNSDVDLGLYYRHSLDVAGLASLADEVAAPGFAVVPPGSWGHWVDGGAWLTIGGTSIDWIYRDLDRVRDSCDDAQQGRYRFHFQVGHPLGFPDFVYAAEVALGIVLADPTGALSELQNAVAGYPAALATALVDGLAEARFLLAAARKAAPRTDTVFVAGCLFRVIGVCAHALHGRAGRWLINEKGAIAAAGRLAIAPTDFPGRASELMGQVGRTPDELIATIDRAADLVTDTETACS